MREKGLRKRLVVALSSLLLIVACGTVQEKESDSMRSFRTVPPALSGVDWKRTPTDVLSNPVKDEPLIWAGIVERVYVRPKGGKIEMEWLCKHLMFTKPGPRAIAERPVELKDGTGFFALSLVLDDVSMEQAERFQRDHTATPHYMLAGGTFVQIVEREGRKVPFLNPVRFGLGRDLAVFNED